MSFNVKNVDSDADDVFTGLFNVGTDGIADSLGGDLSGSTTFLHASVDAAPPAKVPFGPRQTIVSGIANPRTLETADLDRDGDLDLLVAFGDAARIAWYRNTDGAGTFALGQNLTTTASGALGLAAVDIDGDGDLDVVGTAFQSDLLAWFENTDGAGTFGAQQTISTLHDGAIGLAAEDFDRDGDVDLAVCSVFDDELAWFENTDGAGAFLRHLLNSSSNECRSLDAADVDADGDLDLLQGNLGVLNWYENRLGEPESVIAGPIEVFDVTSTPLNVGFADIDGDGDADALMGSQGGMLAWYPNGGATFGVQNPIKTGGSTPGVSVGDPDADGDLDVVSFQQGSNLVEWHENTAGDGSAWTAHTIGTEGNWPLDAHFADVDGDGDLDVLSSSQTDQVVGWYENLSIHRNAKFPYRNTIHANAGNRATAWADLDSDGDADVLSSDVGSLRWHQNTAGNGLAWTPLEIATGSADWRESTAADLDADGDLDVLATLFASDSVVWYENDGTPGGTGDWSPHALPGTHDGAVAVLAADIDGDGNLDVVAASANDDKLRWHENVDGVGLTWNTTEIATAGLVFAISIEAADMDRDGDLDVVAAGNALNTVSWYENDGAPGEPSWTVHPIAAITAGGELDVMDMDRDGDLDVLSAGEGDVRWHENPVVGGTTWTNHDVAITTPASSGANRVAAADLDADGDFDVLLTASNDSGVGWWENTAGDGSAWDPHQEDLVTSRDDLSAVDLDCDGDLDLVSNENGTGVLAWDENRGGQFALTTTSSAPAWMLEGTADDLLKIEAVHNGRAGDSNVELATLELLIEGMPGNPLPTTVANAVIDVLEIYLDDGSGDFESMTDTLVTSVDTLALSNSVQTVLLADGDANAAVAQGTPSTYFVVTQLTADASSQGTPAIHLTHLTTEPSSSAEDASWDSALSMEYTPDYSSGVVYLLGPSGDSDADGITNDDEANVYGTNPLDTDTDDDGFCDGPLSPGGCTAGDNCPVIANGAQTNSDAALAGDDCQCGDVGGAAGIDASDLLALRENLVGRTPSGGAPSLDRCDVDGDGDCDVEDVYVLERFLDGAAATIENACSGYSMP